MTDADYDLVNVHALDDTTLEINLQFPAGYFFSMSALWTLNAVPRETIEEFGDDWTDQENIITNGPFVLDEFVRGVRRILVTNPYYPADMRGPGNVERVVTTVVEDQGTRFALYLDNQIDSSGSIPRAEVQAILNDPAYADQLYNVSDLGVFYFGFAQDKPPFDNVRPPRVQRDGQPRRVHRGGKPTARADDPLHAARHVWRRPSMKWAWATIRTRARRWSWPVTELRHPEITINSFDSAGDWAEFWRCRGRELAATPTYSPSS